ncbi:hypothetical protein AB0H34_16785 [Saccharopolyspora shandongensis]
MTPSLPRVGVGVQDRLVGQIRVVDRIHHRIERRPDLVVRQRRELRLQQRFQLVADPVPDAFGEVLQPLALPQCRQLGRGEFRQRRGPLLRLAALLQPRPHGPLGDGLADLARDGLHPGDDVPL